MWINIFDLDPIYPGPYIVFGTVNKGTEHETRGKFTAYWEPKTKSFKDKDGEDLIGINEGVEYWFDSSQLPNPA